MKSIKELNKLADSQTKEVVSTINTIVDDMSFIESEIGRAHV